MKNVLLVFAFSLISSSSVFAQFQFEDGGQDQPPQAPASGERNSFEMVAPSDATGDPNARRRNRAPSGETPLGAPLEPVDAPQEIPLGAPLRPDTDIRNPQIGPSEVFVYVNETGYWKISPRGYPPGRGRYVWVEDGSSNNDLLRYLGYGNVIEREGFGVRRGTQVPCWAYEARSADGNTVYFYFGVNPIRPNPRGSGAVEVYPFYYSFDPPGSGAQPRRLLTESGTTRY